MPTFNRLSMYYFIMRVWYSSKNHKGDEQVQGLSHSPMVFMPSETGANFGIHYLVHGISVLALWIPLM
jgi:hypothetical protein